MSYLLDTCVISHLRHDISPQVRDWFSDKDDNLFYVSAVTLAEIEDGIERLKTSRKKKDLEEWFYGSFQNNFQNRILPIEEAIARTWGRLNARIMQNGYTVGVQDLYIAATALVHGFGVVTTNTKDFEYTGVVVFNPWKK